jgi:hypothetical protein
MPSSYNSEGKCYEPDMIIEDVCRRGLNGIDDEKTAEMALTLWPFYLTGQLGIGGDFGCIAACIASKQLRM